MDKFYLFRYHFNSIIILTKDYRFYFTERVSIEKPMESAKENKII
jgi:hypothetical protein